MRFLEFFAVVNIFYAFILCECAIVNKDVERTIDLRSQLVKVSYKITAINISDEDYIFALPHNVCKNLSFISVKDNQKREKKIKERNSENGCEFLFGLNSTVQFSTIYIETVFSKLLHPHPKEITQSEKQYVKYSGNLYVFSPYKTQTQRTTVQLSSENILAYTQLKPFSVSNNVLRYGPYENIQEYSEVPLDVHFENQSPFLTVTQLERTIEVSHWGNIAVEEKIHLSHSGARLKGPFSRYELQKDSRSGQAAVKSYKTLLPSSSSGVYYRDSNGNISTSNMKISLDAVELELRPRFTLFGGWKTNYILGYNVPSFEYLFNREKQFTLQMRIIDHIYDDMIIDKASVRIILPEGSSNIQLITPYSVIREADETYHTYLDTIGRPVVCFVKYNLVENHINDFNLKYTYSRLSMLQEPFLVVGFIFSLFLIIIVFVRLDFSISKKGPHYHND